jgi:hypothetical protein
VSCHCRIAGKLGSSNYWKKAAIRAIQMCLNGNWKNKKLKLENNFLQTALECFLEMCHQMFYFSREI